VKKLMLDVSKHYGQQFKFSNHTFRRTFGRQFYYENDKDIGLTQKVLGHKSPAQTVEYLGLDQDDQVRGMKNVENNITKMMQEVEE
jgi:integrase